jgi:hypothetical protein
MTESQGTTAQAVGNTSCCVRRIQSNRQHPLSIRQHLLVQAKRCMSEPKKERDGARVLPAKERFLGLRRGRRWAPWWSPVSTQARPPAGPLGTPTRGVRERQNRALPRPKSVAGVAPSFSLLIERFPDWRWGRRGAQRWRRPKREIVVPPAESLVAAGQGAGLGAAGRSDGAAGGGPDLGRESAGPLGTPRRPREAHHAHRSPKGADGVAL